MREIGMSETPRTDEYVKAETGIGFNSRVANFARQLERELTTEYQRGLNAGLEQAARICDEVCEDSMHAEDAAIRIRAQIKK